MPVQSGNYTSSQLQGYGLNPNNTTEIQNIGGVQYRLSNDGRGGRNVEVIGGGGGGGGGNAQSYINDAIRRLQEANRPAVDSYNTQLGETSQKYSGEKSRIEASRQPLIDRYRSLIDSIRGDQAVATDRQTVTTNNELGKRGLLSSSGVAQQEMTNALNPITQKYSTLARDTGLAQEDDLRGIEDRIAGLVPQETADKRAILNAIAQLQSGASTQGIQLGTNLYQTDLQAATARQQAEQEARQQEIANRIAEQGMANQTAQTNYNVRAPYFKPEGGGGNDINSLLQLLGIGGSNNSRGRRPTSRPVVYGPGY